MRISELPDPPELDTVTDTQISLSIPDELRADVHGVQVVHQIRMGTPPELHRGFASNVEPFVLSPTITDVVAANATEVTVTLSPAVGREQRAVLLLNEFEPPEDRPARAHSFSEYLAIFTITQQSLDDLEAAGVPEAVVDALADLIDQEILGEENFLNTVIATIGAQQTEQFRALILRHAALPEAESITFPISGVEPGEYLVRVQVDGAQSPLEVDPDPDNPRYIGPTVTVP